MTEVTEITESVESVEDITVKFSFQQLAGLYFLANVGLISMIMNPMIESVNIRDPETNGDKFKEIEFAYRDAVLAVRENGDSTPVIQKADEIFNLLVKLDEESRNEAADPSVSNSNSSAEA